MSVVNELSYHYFIKKRFFFPQWRVITFFIFSETQARTEVNFHTQIFFELEKQTWVITCLYLFVYVSRKT